MDELHQLLIEANGVQLRWNVSGVDASGAIDPLNFAVRLFTVDFAKGEGGFDAPLRSQEITKLHAFLSPFVERLGTTGEGSGLRVVDSAASIDAAELLDALTGYDKSEILKAVKTHLGSDITDTDVQMLVDRRSTLDHFERLLADPDFFNSEQERLGLSGPEAVWQRFFETHQWIFGYGLTLVSCDSIGTEKLEVITTGANVFTGGGKRIDAAMRTRGFIQSLLFAEIKRHDTDLLTKQPYREPDVYQVSKELSGAVAQVQKTAHKAIKDLQDLHRQSNPSGDFEFEVSTIAPRQIVVVGHLRELAPDGAINTEKMTSFELFRRTQVGVDILTFDEVFERAKFIVESGE
ncbi:MAG: DUF4263 domain-containing protein [bacterium]|nr:DUF4263 domain-containing protein [bacterium]